MIDADFISASATMLVVNLIYAAVSLVVGVVVLRWLDRVFLKQLDLEQEIKSGNLAAAVFASALVLFMAVIIGCSLGK